MRYYTSCIGSTYEKIWAMKDRAREITYQTFRKYAEGLDEIEEDFGYGPWLRLKDDFAVRYYKSWYCGRPCVYMSHSAIEYIWILE